MNFIRHFTFKTQPKRKDSRSEIKSLAEDILVEETSVEICSNCDEHIDENDCLVCEVCNSNCHMKCIIAHRKWNNMFSL